MPVLQFFFRTLLICVSGLSAQAVMGQDLANLSLSMNKSVGRVIDFASSGTGTGFVVGQDRSGNWLFITNNHVVDRNSDEVIVMFASDEVLTGGSTPRVSKYTAKLRETNQTFDLSLLELTHLSGTPRWTLNALEVARYDLSQGHQVAAFGFPGVADDLLGDEFDEVLFTTSSLSTGVVSRIAQSTDWATNGSNTAVEIVQHDASINKGNSGGPLVDHCGAVVGVNTQGIRNRTGGDVYAASHARVLRVFLNDSNVQFSEQRTVCTAGGSLTRSSIHWPFVVIAGALGLLAAYFVLRLAAPEVAKAPVAVVSRVRVSKRAFRPQQKSVRKSKAVSSHPSVRLRIASKLKTKEYSVSVAELTAGIIIGRSTSADYVIDDPSSSRRHLKLQLQDRKMMATDIGSKNGTFVNSHRLEESKATQINSKSQIRIGDTVLTIGTG